eukprot:6184300-Pleurochrysis_carterae.AAC.3
MPNGSCAAAHSGTTSTSVSSTCISLQTPQSAVSSAEPLICYLAQAEASCEFKPFSAPTKGVLGRSLLIGLAALR